MTKARHPLSVEQALHEVLGLLGTAEAGAVTGKSATILRNWADPDNDAYRLPMEAAMALDRACILAGHERAPLLLAYQAAIGRVQAKRHAPAALALRLVELAQRLGDVAGEMRAAVCVHGDGGAAVTDRELASALADVQAMQAALDDLQRDLIAANARAAG
ncbi:phage regulatory CII family protein [Niveispirillum sp.]|uniref:phage regulatory CII family protein n=1 Tax=Niveispirillum sp. TaxID=1917217 RepID=UPI001B46794D|nr:phage regulatory CII family protein [Niveispirillum sp.]MBP7336892.1 hypothetical protein [Niveispirillum sp.]